MLVLGPVSLFYDEQVPLAERRRLFRDLTQLLGRIKSQAALLLLQPLMPKEADNRHFGKLLAPMIDYLVEVEIREGHGEAIRRSTLAPPPAGRLHPTLPPPAFKKETFKVNVSLSECQYLHAGLKFSARLKHLRQALALPEDAPTYLLEITKFLATGR